MSWDGARAWREERRGRVVFTNGVFDLLHPGHIDVLVGARSRGDALIVGINSDASVKRLKGPERPIRSEADREFIGETVVRLSDQHRQIVQFDLERRSLNGR